MSYIYLMDEANACRKLAGLAGKIAELNPNLSPGEFILTLKANYLSPPQDSGCMKICVSLLISWTFPLT